MVATNKRYNLKKEDISKNIASVIGVPALYSAKIVNDIIRVLISNFASGKNLKIKNFGSFMLHEKKERIGRNPKNNKRFNIKERRVILFKASNNLKVKINKNVSK